MQPPNVIAAKGAKQIQQKVSAERGTNVTMLAFINAAGGTVPPVFVFTRKKSATPYSTFLPSDVRIMAEHSLDIHVLNG
ncbi:hypothetical protein OUZ56_032686 [Daphnia magna]|nr:hypothetical protein OUZ56_032686 [Daphnia magna]